MFDASLCWKLKVFIIIVLKNQGFSWLQSSVGNCNFKMAGVQYGGKWTRAFNRALLDDTVAVKFSTNYYLLIFNTQKANYANPSHLTCNYSVGYLVIKLNTNTWWATYSLVSRYIHKYNFTIYASLQLHS